MVEQQTREGVKTGRRWLVAASPEKKNLKNFAIIFGFFSHFYFAECFSGTRQRLCRVPDKKHSANSCLLTKRYRVLYAECYTRQSSCRVFSGHCRVPLALGETTVSRSALGFLYTMVRCIWRPILVVQTISKHVDQAFHHCWHPCMRPYLISYM